MAELEPLGRQAVVVRVLAEEGEPCPGADVTIGSIEPLTSVEPLNEEREVNRSDERGQCVVRLDSTRGVLIAYAHREPHAGLSGSFTAVIGEGSERVVTIRLGAATRIRGSVIDPDGAPVAGVVIGFSTSPPEAIDALSCRSDASGCFTSPLLPKAMTSPGGRVIRVAARATGFAVAHLRLEETQVGSEPLQIVLRRPWRARGRVADDAGRALPGATILDAITGESWESDATGGFSVEGHEKSRGALVVFHEGFSPSAVHPVDSREGREARLGTVALRRGTEFRARLVGADGNPVRRALVIQCAPPASILDTSAGGCREIGVMPLTWTRTDDDGSFALRLEEGAVFDLAIRVDSDSIGAVHHGQDEPVARGITAEKSGCVIHLDALPRRTRHSE